MSVVLFVKKIDSTHLPCIKSGVVRIQQQRYVSEMSNDCYLGQKYYIANNFFVTHNPCVDESITAVKHRGR